VTFGGIAAPLLYISPNQINVQVPFEVSGAGVDVIVQNGGTSSLPVHVKLVAQDPGIFSIQGGHVPLQPGDVISILATGLGPVVPPVADGVAARSSPQSTTLIPPVVKISGQWLIPTSSTLAVGMVGVYVVTATVPLTTQGSVIVSLEAQLSGPTGPNGPGGWIHRGTWNGTTSYQVTDLVVYNGTSYISLTNQNLGQTPDVCSVSFIVQSEKPEVYKTEICTSDSWGMLAQVGPAGPAGLAGIDGADGAVGADGPAGLTGPAGIDGADGAVGADGPAGPAGPAGIDGADGAVGADGPAGPAGPAGIDGADGPGGSLAFADYFALMPPDNAATVAPGTDVSFPQDGPVSAGAVIARTSPSSFTLSAVGTYQIMFQVSVNEAGQLLLTLNDVDLAYTVAGRATGTNQIVGIALVTTTVVNSILTVRNPAGNAAALTITPLAGGARSVSAHLVITQIQ
jgi:uncharacterized protein (TIGR03437 family)